VSRLVLLRAGSDMRTPRSESITLELRHLLAYVLEEDSCMSLCSSTHKPSILQSPQVIFNKFGLHAANVAQKALRVIEFFAGQPAPSKLLRPF